MIVYINFFLINLLISKLYLYKKDKKIIILSFLLLNIFFCLNYRNGVDWIQYYVSYINSPKIFDENFYLKLSKINVRGSEYLFIYLLIIFKSIFNCRYEVFQYVVLSIDLYVIYKFLKKNTEYPLLVILFGMKFISYLMLEPILRQLQAIVIFYISIDFIYKEKYIKYYFFNMLAILFHTSSVILFPVYFFKKIKFSIKKTIILFMFFMLFVAFLNEILSIIFSIEFLKHYKAYLTNKTYGYSKELPLLKLLKIIIFDIGIFYLIAYLYNKGKKKIKNFEFIAWCNFYLIVIRIFSLKLAIIFRFNNFFYLIQIIYICFLFQILRTRSIKRVSMILFTTYFFMIYVIEMKAWEKKEIPKYSNYSNYFFNKKIKNEGKIIELLEIEINKRK